MYITTNTELTKGESILVLVDAFENLEEAQIEKNKY